MTVLWVGHPRTYDSIPGICRGSFLFFKRPPGLLRLWYRHCVQSSFGVEFNTCISLFLTSRMTGTTPSVTHMLSWRKQGQHCIEILMETTEL